MSSSPSADKARQMLLDLARMTRMICEPIRHGKVRLGDFEYQLSFSIRDDVYMELVALTCRFHSSKPPYDKCKLYDTLFGLPVFVTGDFDAPPVSLCIHPAVVDLTDDNETKKENQQ